MKPGRWFRVAVVLLLAGIFIELAAILSYLLGGEGGGYGNVAIVELRGTIGDPRDTVKALRRYAKKEKVKAIVLRVDSPGGPVASSQEIHDCVEETAAKKPLVVSMGDVAASGGYYVAAPATKIVANPGTITGSIGVIAYLFNLEELLKRAHLSWDVIKSGEVKDIGSPLRPMTPRERKLMQGMTDDMHLQFIQAVAKGRKIPLEKVRELASGRIYSGRQAREVGLVDELGGLAKAIHVAAALAKIEGEPDVIYPEREKFGWLRRLAEGKFGTSALHVEYRLTP